MRENEINGAGVEKVEMKWKLLDTISGKRRADFKLRLLAGILCSIDLNSCAVSLNIIIDKKCVGGDG